MGSLSFIIFLQRYFIKREQLRAYFYSLPTRPRGITARFDKFFNRGITENQENEIKYAQLNISINTDDLGVFDTSLEFEYALLFRALKDVLKGGAVFDVDPVKYHQELSRLAKEEWIQEEDWYRLEQVRNTPWIYGRLRRTINFLFKKK